MLHDFDCLVFGNETEGALAAYAAASAGARTAWLVPPGQRKGGLLTRDGLAFVDRDSRHGVPVADSLHDGLFGTFLREAGVHRIALEAATGERTLEAMLARAGVTVLTGRLAEVRVEHGRLTGLRLEDGTALSAASVIDASADADLAEVAGMPFEWGFTRYGLPNYLGVSPLPILTGVPVEALVETTRRLIADPALDALRARHFGAREFLDLDVGPDWLVIGPPHLGLAFGRYVERLGLPPRPFAFEADGFNVAVLGPEMTSWNGLIYFCTEPEQLLAWSRGGADAFMRAEAELFARFFREELGFARAELVMPQGIYVRQTRHALATRHRVSLAGLGASEAVSPVGTFCYYPDFRGFRAVKVPGPLTAHVSLEAGLASEVSNLGLACRAGGATPFGHSLTRLVQYNATLGTALGVASALASAEGLALAEVPASAVREAQRRLGFAAEDPSGFERNASVAEAMARDPVLALERKPCLA